MQNHGVYATAEYDNHPPSGLQSVEADVFDQLIVELGNQLEQKYLHQFQEKYQVVEAFSVSHTQELMAAGTEVIYQGIFNKDDVIGKPDFLCIQPDGTYQPADVKLAHGLDDKKDIQIQLGFYRRLLGSDLPARVFLGTGEIEEVGPEADKKVDAFLASMREILARDVPPAVRYNETKCKACSYLTTP